METAFLLICYAGLSGKQASSLSKNKVLHSFAFMFPVNIFHYILQTETWLLRCMKYALEWPRAKRRVLERDETQTKRLV